jgi:hypothetical protein
MAARKDQPAAGELYTLVVDVLHNGELFKAGLQLLGNDELVRGRPELFVRFGLGYRAVVAAIAELERAEREEQAQQARQAAAKEEPRPQPERVVCVKAFQHRGRDVAVGSVWLKATKQSRARPPHSQPCRNKRDATTPNIAKFACACHAAARGKPENEQSGSARSPEPLA